MDIRNNKNLTRNSDVKLLISCVLWYSKRIHGTWPMMDLWRIKPDPIYSGRCVLDMVHVRWCDASFYVMWLQRVVWLYIFITRHIERGGWLSALVPISKGDALFPTFPTAARTSARAVFFSKSSVIAFIPVVPIRHGHALSLWFTHP